MLENLTQQPPDKIIQLSGMFRADERDTKIDLGVGVYKDANGNTPIMRAVKKAEQLLWNEETTKSYTALVGDGAFHKVMADLVLGDSVSSDRLAFAHAPGGTGAIRQILELIKVASPDATVWMSDPTWPNHPAMVKGVGIPMRTYTYLNMETRTVDFDGMMEDLAQAKAGDIVILHGCCHNPTGANLNQTQWGEVADLLVAKGAVPFVDIAYQGFGDGLQEDAFGVRLLAQQCPEMLISASCSKNFGIYRERCGLVITVSKDADNTALAQGMLSSLNRLNFSFPPDHGARLVTMVLSDPELRADWEAELEEVRTGMLKLRKQLADALRAETGSDRYGFIAEHRGMFSRLGLSEEQVVKLREDHAIYMIGDSRFNVAGLNEKSIPVIAKAIVAVGG
ncbi:amino acid aminotransferase [Amylibacter sp. IMCC11727]|uniref:amino acid aminotransferase n=1 Tax=Amylibacter sp. IMCC11727 TaxID=3039851 RepID=UPI00244E29FB|nr:amino acid aminotransferase [Amylibacter sp. IMCC11727]WGI22355.1 aspartate/tyrosine/aromatic aminotransferase [Amylibacter sp. IMCC11727]